MLISSLCIVTSIYSEKREEKSFAYCIGAATLIEIREANRSLSDIAFEQELKLPFGVRPTILLGRHFYPLKWFRIELLAEYSFSKAENDTIADFSTVKNYKAGGASLNLNLVKKIDDSFNLFAGAGGGLLITSVEAENNDIGYGAFKIRNASPVLNIEGGCEIIPGGKVGFSIGYIYRLWRPAKFTDDRDMPLQGADYKEIVNGHGAYFKILLGRK